MPIEAWICMITVWTGATALVIFCYYKILTKKKQ